MLGPSSILLASMVVCNVVVRGKGWVSHDSGCGL